MMNMGFMFPGFGGFFGWIFLLIPLMAIFIGVRFLRRKYGAGHKYFGNNESKSSEDNGPSIEKQILKLAFEKKGILTVTDVVMETGLSISKAEETLNSMVDGFRVDMRVKDSGIVVYAFTEIIDEEETKHIR